MREPLHGPFVWTGDQLAGSSDWLFVLTAAMTEEIDAALAAVERRGIAWPQMRRGDFKIPQTAELLGEIATILEEGCGLAKLSGLPVARYAEEDLRAIWYGIGLHLGTPVSQSHAGLRMKTIRDEGAEVGQAYGEMRQGDGPSFLSAYARAVSNGPLRFHTDRTDVVGLLCIDQASAGGLSKIASTVAVHNEILCRRPDLLEVLYQPYPRSRLGEEKGGGEMVYMLPIFGLCDGRFTSHYSRTYIEAAQKLDHVPRLTAQQTEAIDLLTAASLVVAYFSTLMLNFCDFSRFAPDRKTVIVANFTGDSTPPSVAITAPGAGATVHGTTTVAANAGDNVGVLGVQFRVNGSNLGAEVTAAPYAMAWNTTGKANGAYTLTAVARDAAGNTTTSTGVTLTVSNSASSGGTLQNVIWTSLVNVTASGNSLQKTSGCDGCLDAGAVSTQQIYSGNGYVKFTASETDALRYIGLSRGNAGTGVRGILFAIRLQSGIAEVRESSIYRADTTFVPGDRFRINVESGVVKYYKNGALFYRSGIQPSYPLLVQKGEVV